MDFRGVKPLLFVMSCISLCSMAYSRNVQCRECFQQVYNDTAMFREGDIHRLYPGLFRNTFGKGRGQARKVCKKDRSLGKICYVKNTRGFSPPGCDQGVSDYDSCCPTCTYQAVFDMAPLANNPAVLKFVVHMPWTDMYQSAQLGECGSPSSCNRCEAVQKQHLMLLSDFPVNTLFDFLWIPLHWDFVNLSTYCRCLN